MKGNDQSKAKTKSHHDQIKETNDTISTIEYKTLKRKKLT